ncbi:hypothetical protein [Cupriavidus sp. SW-Y-13]|uniref:hypothetical protein n=1 Tax=Cupriavidus sp. SW-Y-13 TaxID=2653854 RepID=UPI001365FFEE|nr:hypothetical protein [Cupriavidus sp. SW-Y-13]MWL88902.1 hypothetical protein [Cupriavidus sp. SW-Y-13]
MTRTAPTIEDEGDVQKRIGGVAALFGFLGELTLEEFDACNEEIAELFLGQSDENDDWDAQ